MDKNLASFLDPTKLAQIKTSHPHKYILLLSILQLYRLNPDRENKIYLNEIIKIFNKIAAILWKKEGQHPWQIEYPFFYLTKNHFWFLKIKHNKDAEYTSIIKQHDSRFTLKRIREIIDYAYLTEEVHKDFQDRQLRETLVEKVKKLCIASTKMENKGVSNNLMVQQQIPYSFIKYLATLQRIHGGNANALAEFQAQNPLFSRIAAPHPLEEALITDLREGTHGIILTGHAGDGKTTLAFAVYRALCGIPADQPLPELAQSRIDFSIDGHAALLIKDLSEQKRNRRGELMDALRNSSIRSLLVSNTGALREFFLSQEPDTSRHVALESDLLTSLSRERDDTFSFRGRRFKIYNLALRDNLSLAQTVLSNMLAPDLWSQCASCRHQARCPAHFNRTLLADGSSPVRQRLFLAYRRLQAYGVRLTMRQLSEHLAYCLTGGLDERRLCRADELDPGIGSPQHMYNLFFGGPRAQPENHVTDMAAIRAVREQWIGAHPLPCLDKKLWHTLSPEAETLGLPPQVVPHFQRLTRLGGTHTDPRTSAEARLQARRLLYFCAAPTVEALRDRLQKEFLRSPGVLLYAGLTGKNQLEQKTRHHLLTSLFHVLQERFTGIHLPTTGQKRGRDTLYITLNRSTPLMRQSVQTVLCAISWQENVDLRLEERPDGTPALLLTGRRALRDITPLELTVPFLDYVLRRYDGEIGDLPRGTFVQQLDTLKAQIIRCMREDEEEPRTMRLLRYCSDYSLVQDEYLLHNETLEVIRGTR